MINPDNLNIASSLPTFVNPTTSTGTITISGNVGNGVTANFSTTIFTAVPVNLFRTDIYGLNNTTNVKLLLNTLLVMTTQLNGYSYKSTESVQMEIYYNQGLNDVTVQYSVFNGTGGTITLNTQTITASVVQYQVPF